jgi:DNA-binding CsgD family transcriptional regulator/tetratricopeptide (TPR) repeat protein
MAADPAGHRDRPHVGRHHELSTLLSSVSRADGRGAIVAGVAGVGKSHLLEQASTVLTGDGWTALRARGDPTRATPFGSMGGLLPPLGNDDPERWALVLRRGLDHLVERAAPLRPLLLADDLQSFDSASATLVQQAVLDGRLRLLGTLRTGDDAPDAVTALWKDDLVDRVDLSPLTRHDADELVERLMGGPVDAETRSRLWGWVDGSPLLITEVVAQAQKRGSWRRTAGLWHLEPGDGQQVRSPTLAAMLAERMADAPAGVADAVDALALAGHLPLEVLDRLVGIRALAAAERARLTRSRTEGDVQVMALDHPLYGELRRDQLDPERTTDLLDRLLDVFEGLPAIAPADVPLLARWSVETGRTGPRTAELLIAAAERAWVGNDPRAAADLARRARSLQRTDRADQILVGSLARLGAVDELAPVAHEVMRTAESDDVRAEAALNHALAVFQFANQPDEAETLLTEAEDFLTEPQWREAVVRQRAMFRLQRGDLAGAEEIARPMLDSTDDEVLVAGSAVLSPIVLLRGQVVEALELAERGLALAFQLRAAGGAQDDGALGELLFHQIGAWVEAGRVADADQVAQGAIAALDQDVDPFSRAFVAFQVGRIARLRGRPETASRWFREAVAGFEAISRSGFVAWALAGLCAVRAQVGDTEGAQTAAARCRTWRDHPIGLAAGEVDRALAWELVATRDLPGAHDALARAAERSLAAGDLVHAAHAYHDMVSVGAAGRAAGPLRELRARSDGQLLAAFSAHADASVARDPDALSEVAGRLEGFGCDLLAAEAWSEAVADATASSAPGSERVAMAAQRRATQALRRCEGARTPLLAAGTDGLDLSRREREIAELTVAGMRRRDIAEKLVISPRTVDSHLQRIYRKLGVNDRDGLANALSTDVADDVSPERVNYQHLS